MECYNINNETAKSRYARLLEDSVMIINVPGGTSLVSGVKVKVKSLSCVRLCDPINCSLDCSLQVSLSMGFSRQEYQRMGCH